MKALVDQTCNYFKEVLGLALLPHPWDGLTGLPIYLQDRYDLFQVDILGISCMWVVDRESSALTPAMIEKHLIQIADVSGIRGIYMKSTITPYDRKRLIERKVPFVIPGNQMFLPFLGMDLRERMFKPQKATHILTASCQHLLLYMLQEKCYEISQSRAAELLGYSRMTMSRAFQELKLAGIGKQSVTDRVKNLCLSGTRREIWDTVLPYMKNPVMKKLYALIDEVELSNKQVFMSAGESALAECTLLAEPKTPVYAVRGTDWTKRPEKDVEVPYPELGAVQIELWMHPMICDMDKIRISPFALYLTLMDNPDERIQDALHKMMEGELDEKIMGRTLDKSQT